MAPGSMMNILLLTSRDFHFVYKVFFFFSRVDICVPRKSTKNYFAWNRFLIHIRPFEFHSCSSFYSPFLPFLSFSRYMYSFFFQFLSRFDFGFYIVPQAQGMCVCALAIVCVFFFSFMQQTIFFIRIYNNNGRTARQAKWVHCLFLKWNENKFSNMSVESVFWPNSVRWVDCIMRNSDLNFRQSGWRNMNIIRARSQSERTHESSVATKWVFFYIFITYSPTRLSPDQLHCNCIPPSSPFAQVFDEFHQRWRKIGDSASSFNGSLQHVLLSHMSIEAHHVSRMERKTEKNIRITSKENEKMVVCIPCLMKFNPAVVRVCVQRIFIRRS